MENEILLNGLQYYYLVFAWAATVLFVIKLLIFVLFGGDGTEVQADFNVETDSDPSFSFVSLQSILAFLMAFGWGGYSILKLTKLGQFWSLIGAIVIGIIFMHITARLMFSVKKLEKTVKKDKTTTVGKYGKAYSNFEPKGQGQIEIIYNGQLMVEDAINMTDEKIKSFEKVKVVKVENDIMYIEKEIKYY